MTDRVASRSRRPLPVKGGPARLDRSSDLPVSPGRVPAPETRKPGRGTGMHRSAGSRRAVFTASSCSRIDPPGSPRNRPDRCIRSDGTRTIGRSRCREPGQVHGCAVVRQPAATRRCDRPGPPQALPCRRRDRRHRARCQTERVNPPSTRMFCPVMYAASSDARNAIRAETSCTRP